MRKRYKKMEKARERDRKRMEGVERVNKYGRKIEGDESDRVETKENRR